MQKVGEEFPPNINGQKSKAEQMVVHLLYMLHIEQPCPTLSTPSCRSTADCSVEGRTTSSVWLVPRRER